MTKQSEVPLCPKCGEHHWRHEPCEKPEIFFGIDPAGENSDSTIIAKVKDGKVIEYHDFRDRGDPMQKVEPDPSHWSRWREREDKIR